MGKSVELECRNCHSVFWRDQKEVNRQIRKGRDYFFCSQSCSARAKYRSRKNSRKECKIDAKDLKDLFEFQGGICPLTGWKLSLPINTEIGFENHDIKNASLDRIDHAKGYIPGNLRFVAIIANVARSNYSDYDLVKFCSAVVNNM